MDRTIRDRVNDYISLQTFAAAAVAFIVFGGRFGLAGNPQSSGLSVVGDLFYMNFLQIRWWLAFGVLALAAVDYCLNRRPRTTTSSIPFGLIGFAMVVIPLFLSIAYAGGSEKTIEKGVDLIILCLTVLGVHYWASRPTDSAWTFGRTVLFFCLVLGMMIAAIAAATADISDRMAFGEGGPNTFVRIVGVTALACLGLKLIPRPLAIVFTISLLTLVVLTQSRGGLLACVAAIAVLFLRTFSWRSKVAYIGIFVAGLAGVVMYTEIGQHCVDIINERYINLTLHDGYTAGRDKIYEDSYHIWMESFVFGHGLNSWWDRIGIYPHNIFLELGCDAGAIAVVGFGMLLLFYGYETLRTRDPTKIVLSSACILYLIAAQFSGDIYDSRSLFIFGTILLASQSDKLDRQADVPEVTHQVTKSKPASAAKVGPEWSLHPASRYR